MRSISKTIICCLSVASRRVPARWGFLGRRPRRAVLSPKWVASRDKNSEPQIVVSYLDSCPVEPHFGPQPQFQPGFVPGDGRFGPRPQFQPGLVPVEACFRPRPGYPPRLVSVAGRFGPRPWFQPGLVPVEARFRPQPGIIALAHQKSGCLKG